MLSPPGSDSMDGVTFVRVCTKTLGVKQDTYKHYILIVHTPPIRGRVRSKGAQRDELSIGSSAGRLPRPAGAETQGAAGLEPDASAHFSAPKGHELDHHVLVLVGAHAALALRDMRVREFGEREMTSTTTGIFY